MKIIEKLLVISVIFFGIQVAEARIKIINPTDDTDVYVLSDLDCRDRSVIATANSPAKLFGTEKSRGNGAFTGRGCYQMNDAEKIITFTYITGKIIKVPYIKIQVIDIATGKAIKQNKFLTESGRRELATQQEIESAKLDANVVAPMNEPQLRSSVGGGRVIGQSFDSQANGNIFLYDGECQLVNYSANYPLRWDAKKVDDGAFIGEGCYSFNQQTNQVFIVATTGKTAMLPMSEFQGGGSGNKSFFQSFSEGLQRATTYWNNSANETQRNTTNLTPGLTGGSRMNCTPDGRGGYNCR